MIGYSYYNWQILYPNFTYQSRSVRRRPTALAQKPRAIELEHNGRGNSGERIKREDEKPADSPINFREWRNPSSREPK